MLFCAIAVVVGWLGTMLKLGIVPIAKLQLWKASPLKYYPNSYNI